MSSGQSWAPKRVFQLSEILGSRALGQIRVGMSIPEIEFELGAPELPRSRIGRSRVWELLYGNVSVLVSVQSVVGINVDLHCDRFETVRAGPLIEWRFRDWEEYATTHGLDVVRGVETVNLKAHGISVGLNPDGIVLMVSMF